MNNVPSRQLSVQSTQACSDVVESKPENSVTAPKMMSFDGYDVCNRCRELLHRIAVSSGGGSPSWKWDIVEFLEESRQQLRVIRQVHDSDDAGLWQEIGDAFQSDHAQSTLPVGLRRQCEDMLQRRNVWLADFDSELKAILARGREVRERLLFEDVDKAGWFSTSGASPLEVQRLLERHLDMHQRAARFMRQLKLLLRALQQQGAVSSRRTTFQAKTVGEKLQSSLVCLAAVAVAPVPGASEMWLATTTMMWLDKDQAWQHVVYEHPRDADTATILSQFQCHSQTARESVTSWLSMPPAARRNCVLIHNASVRRVIVKTHLVNLIDGYVDTSSDWTAALDSHPLGSVMKKALTMTSAPEENAEKIVVGAQRLAVVQLPKKPDANWGWRGVFSYGDTRVGECRLREGGVFSFICVDCGLFVGDIEGEISEEDPQMVSKTNLGQSESNALAQSDIAADTNTISAREGEIDTDLTAVEVVNRTDDPVGVKIYEYNGEAGTASRLFRSALVEDTLAPGARAKFSLKGSQDSVETNFDVEVRVGMKKAKCEVVGGQVIFVDGILADS